MPRKEFVPIQAKSVLNRVTGMPFRWSINPYRGCSHGCVFCYARRTHWFLQEDGVDNWSSKIFVKVNAPELLRHELRRPSWKREEVALGTATDPYQAIEGRYRITRGILEALRDFRTPVAIVTRCPMIVRDLDILSEMAARAGVTVCVSLATMDPARAREIEPTVAPPAQRLRAVRALADRGIRTGVLLAPILPGLTDSHQHLAEVIQASADSGASFVGHRVLYLGHVTKDAFLRFLDRRHPALLPLYRRLYPGQYIPSSYEKAIARVVAAEKARVGSLEARYLRPPAAPEQMQLL
jgi:DNA repair photolyase